MYLAILEKTIPLLAENIQDACAELTKRRNFVEQDFDYLFQKE
jgi:hypothetical protein